MKSFLLALVAVAALAIFPPVASAHRPLGFNARQIRQGQRAQARVNQKLVAQQLNAHHVQQQLQAVYVPVQQLQQVYVPAQQVQQQNVGCSCLYR